MCRHEIELLADGVLDTLPEDPAPLRIVKVLLSCFICCELQVAAPLAKAKGCKAFPRDPSNPTGSCFHCFVWFVNGHGSGGYR